jgi:polyhydroxybutyrate depolymerase
MSDAGGIWAWAGTWLRTLWKFFTPGVAGALWARDPARVLKRRRLQVDGVERIYYFYAPPTKGALKPLVLIFHGGEGNAKRMARGTAFTRLAAYEGFAVAFPSAMGNWSDGRSVTGTGMNDVRFVRGMIDQLVHFDDIDRSRIYATGASNGGMFTLRLACEMSLEIAAFAPVVASFPVEYWSRCKPARAVPILMINGTADTFIRWEGGSIRYGMYRGLGGEVIPVPQTVEFWRQHNGCPDEPVPRHIKTRHVRDGTRISVLTYGGCRDDTVVELVKIEGGGHTWPDSRDKRAGMARRILMGRISRKINGSETVWAFFKERSLPRAKVNSSIIKGPAYSKSL